MWYEAKARITFPLGKRKKIIKPGDTLYWTPSVVDGTVIIFNGAKAWDAVPARHAVRVMGDLSKPISAKDWTKVAQDYMTVSVR
jgi:hypothetical protein